MLRHNANKKSGIVRNYMDLLKGKWKGLFEIFVTYLIKASPAFVLPVITAAMIDLAVNQTDPHRINKLIIYFSVMMILVAQNIPMHVLYARKLSVIIRGISLNLRQELCRQLQRLSLLYHYRSSMGKLHTKIIRDIEIIEQTPRILTEQVFNFVCQVTIAVTVIAIRKPQALWFFLMGVPVMVFLRSGFKKSVDQSAENYRHSIEVMSSSVSDMLNMIPVTRAHGLEDYHMDRVNSKIVNVFQKGKHFDTITAIFGSTAWAAMTAVHVLFISGSVYASIKGMISIGDIVLFNSMFLILSGQMTVLLNTLPQLSQAQESMCSIKEVLNSPDLEENSGKTTFDEISGQFDFENVNYQYPGTTKHTLTDFNLHVKPGESIAFIGPSGSGKSTILSLVLGFIRPESGALCIDEKNVMDMDLRTYRKHVSIVTQESFFFSGTIFDNVAYGKNTVREQEVIDALITADAYDFISQLPDGMYTHMGSGGVKLSGGQIQRLAIARALLRDPKVLILDEATSSLDSDSERKIQGSIENVMKNRTTFIVAHRLSTISNVDRIIILENGKIVDQGAPDQLIKQDNFYSRAMQQTT